MQQKSEERKLPFVFINERDWDYKLPSSGIFSIPNEVIPDFKKMRPPGYTLTKVCLENVEGREYLVFISMKDEYDMKSRFSKDERLIKIFKSWLV